MKITKILLPPGLLLGSALILVSCRSNTLSSEIPETPTFTNVQVILNQSCGGGSCHLGQTVSGVRLDSYQQVIESVGVRYQSEIIIPGNAASSPLVDKLEASPEFGAQMPFGQSPLSDSEIQLIKNWIDGGAKND